MQEAMRSGRMADAGAFSATCKFYPNLDDRALAVEPILWLGVSTWKRRGMMMHPQRRLAVSLEPAKGGYSSGLGKTQQRDFGIQ
jgi:hypothetical protein